MKITKQNIAIIAEDTHIGKWVEESGRLDHDQNMIPLIIKHINKGDVVIDAGAYIGDHTIAYSDAVGISGHVLAFEPFKQAYDCLVYNLKNRNNTICYNQGLGSKKDLKQFVEYKDNIGMNYLIKGNDILLTTIDSLELNKLNFIKIDCEGMELDILKGGKNTIKRLKPIMLIEINDATLLRSGIKRDRIYDYLQKLNYSFKNIYTEQTLYEHQMDLICIPC